MGHNPSLQKPIDPKLIHKDVIYTFDKSSLSTHFRQGVQFLFSGYRRFLLLKVCK